MSGQENQQRKFVRGVYRLKSDRNNAGGKAPFAYFDGSEFFVFGHDCGLTPSDWSGETAIDVDEVGELVWPDDEELKNIGGE